MKPKNLVPFSRIKERNPEFIEVIMGGAKDYLSPELPDDAKIKAIVERGCKLKSRFACFVVVDEFDKPSAPELFLINEADQGRARQFLLKVHREVCELNFEKLLNFDDARFVSDMVGLRDCACFDSHSFTDGFFPACAVHEHKLSSLSVQL